MELDVLAAWIAAGASSIAAIIALIALCHEIRNNNKERRLSIFLQLRAFYVRIGEEQMQKWDYLKKNSTFMEINDKSTLFNYLLTRQDQSVPLTPFELSCAVDYIRSMNFLNELCKYAIKDKEIESILKESLSFDLFFFQKNLDSILIFRNKLTTTVFFPIPHYEYLKKIDLSGYMPTMVNGIPLDFH
jgi:hypothetical protein